MAYIGKIPIFADMKVLTAEQIHTLDSYTIEHEPISSIELMERAARTLAKEITTRWTNHPPVKVFCGPGNNGGDGLAVSRLLAEQGFEVETYLFNKAGQLSEDCAINAERLKGGLAGVIFHEITSTCDAPCITEKTLVIDALFGSGLNRPLKDGFANIVGFINESPAQVVSIDIPSGLMCEDNSQNNPNAIIHADLTLTLQLPKPSFFFKENQQFLGEVKILDIHLSKEGLSQISENYSVLERKDIQPRLLQRSPFAHKGMMGHALLIAGSRGMAGAALMAAKACLRSGVGKLTIHTPVVNNEMLQTAVPEAVISEDNNENVFSQAVLPDEYKAVAIGPGIGQSPLTGEAFLEQLNESGTLPLVLDADALNILASHKEWLSQVPKNTILTPHPKELDRLLGASQNAYERLSKARQQAIHSQIYIIVKGRYTAIVTPTGYVYFNPTGNPGMATAGSGDVLTGILLGLLARGYTPNNACCVGVYLHGLAGDIAKDEFGEESLLASDIINALPKAFKTLYQK